MTSTEAERLEVIRRGYPQIKLGQSRAEVTAILGPPSRSRPTVAKKGSATASGTSLAYEVTRSGDTPNTNDVLLTLVFDDSDRLIWAYPQNMAGLAELGSRGRE